MYIAVEGIAGVGKSTQAKRLTAYLKTKFVNCEVIQLREPGGTEIANAIRKLVQATEFNEQMEIVCTAYLYAASRAQSLRQVAKPCLDRGGIVIADRSVISSLAQQGSKSGLGIKKVMEINEHAVGGLYPDKVLFLDLPVDVAMARLGDEVGDKWEKMGPAFFNELRQTYLRISKLKMFKNRWVTVDAAGSEDEVFEKAISALGL